MAEKLPDQLFVVFKKSIERSWPNGYDMPYVDEERRVGFLHPHQPNRVTDEKRKNTQLQWAYPGEVTQDHWGQWCRVGSEWDYTLQKHVKIDGPINPMWAPQVWDNDPILGFKIIDTVNRYRGNKLFQVEDPRGGIFEITAQSLFGIITDGAIEKGLIMSKCRWKSGKMLVVAE